MIKVNKIDLSYNLEVGVNILHILSFQMERYWFRVQSLPPFFEEHPHLITHGARKTLFF